MFSGVDQKHLQAQKEKHRIKAMESKEGGRRSSNSLWVGEHASSGLPVSVAYRTDRVVLVSVYLAKQQVCQAPASRFSKEQVESLMIGIGQDFAAGTIEKKDLFAERNSRALVLGVNLKSRATDAMAAQTSKRPASAGPSASSSATSTVEASASGTPQKRLRAKTAVSGDGASAAGASATTSGEGAAAASATNSSREAKRQTPFFMKPPAESLFDGVL